MTFDILTPDEVYVETDQECDSWFHAQEHLIERNGWKGCKLKELPAGEAKGWDFKIQRSDNLVRLYSVIGINDDCGN